MIYVSRFNGEDFVVNSDLIETVDANPDTVITLATGHKLVVRESMDEIIKRVIEYKRSCNFPSEHGRNEVE